MQQEPYSLAFLANTLQSLSCILNDLRMLASNVGAFADVFAEVEQERRGIGGGNEFPEFLSQRQACGRLFDENCTRRF